MSLRVLDDERPGFAILLFSGRLDQPSLSLSIRSLRENAFLGPGGKFQRAPHFFNADRVGDTARGTEYRVGPDVVNHLLEHDQIVVADAEGTLKEETLWENAVPQMPGSGGSHSIYRPPAPIVAETRPTPRFEAPPPRQVAPPPVPPPPPPPPPPPEPPPPPPEPEPEPEPEATAEPTPAVVEVEPTPEPEPEPEDQSTPPSPDPEPKPRPGWARYAFAAIAIVVLALFAVPQVRCGLFGMSCEAPTPTPASNDEILKQAMACAATREGSDPCRVKACFDTYLADTAPRDVASRANVVMDRAAAECKRRQTHAPTEDDALKNARECAAASGNPCTAKSCYDDYMARYGNNGARLNEARNDLSMAAAACHTAMPDGTYSAGSLRGCGIPNEDGIHITVTSGTVSWQHQFKGMRYSWTGTVDGAGNIHASAGPTYTATGRYTDNERDILMKYPQCGSEGIILEIFGRL